MSNAGKNVVIGVHGGYDVTEGKAFVSLQLPGYDYEWSLSPEDALRLAEAIRESAELAINETFMVEFLGKRLEVPQMIQMVLMAEYRNWRRDHGKRG